MHTTKTYEQAILTDHARKRMKERCGLQKKSLERIANKALINGISFMETKGELRRWIMHRYEQNERANNIRIYAEKVFMFHNNQLITVMQIPSMYLNGLHKQLKAA